MRHAISLLSLLVACSAPDVRAPLPSEAMAPPPAQPALGLEVSGLYAAQTASFRVDGLNPGESVYLLRASTAATPGFCPPVTGGMCLDLAPPVAVIGSVMADASGQAELSLTLPPGLPGGLPVVVQAASVRGPGGTLSVRSPAIRRVTGAAPPDAVQDLGPGDLVLTEIMQDPTVVSDSAGEWFELVNTSGLTVDLAGLEVTDRGTDRYVVPSSWVLGPDERAVVGVNDDPATNGGVPVDLQWTGLTLANGVDELVLANRAMEIDVVAWDDGLTFPDPSGQSMSLDARHTDATSNDDGDLWCASAGTPGLENDLCPLPVCGDGAVDPGETCDDGGTAPGDGCDAACHVEGCALPEITTGVWSLYSDDHQLAIDGPGGDVYLVARAFDAWITRLDGGTMNPMWSTEWNASWHVQMLPLAGGGVMVLGQFGDTWHSFPILTVVDSAGALARDQLSLRDYTYEDFVGHRLLPTRDGGYLLLGSAWGSHAIMMRLDADLNILWWKNRFQTYPHELGAFVDGAELPNGDFLLVGEEPWLLRVDAAGNTLWARRADDTALRFRDLELAADGTAWVLADHGGSDARVIRFDADGDIVWSQTVSSGGGARNVSALDLVPGTCEGLPSDGAACAMPGQTCATATDHCVCDAGGTWSCEAGAQGAVVGYTRGGPTLTHLMADGTADATITFPSTSRLRSLSASHRGGILALIQNSYDTSLVQTDDALNGACTATALTVTTSPYAVAMSAGTVQTRSYFPMYASDRVTSEGPWTEVPPVTVCQGSVCP